MGQRHLARQRALELIYALEYADPEETFEEVEARYLAVEKARKRAWHDFASQLARATFERRAELDGMIRPLLHNWRLERLPLLERLCLRMAICELREFPDIPLRVTINEYIELTRAYSADEATPYVNAVLDRVSRDYAQKDFQCAPEADAKATESGVAPGAAGETNPS